MIRPPAAGPDGVDARLPRAATHRSFALKEIVIAPENSARGLDPHQGAVLLHDGVTGELIAILNASPVTEIRTAAVSAAATQGCSPARTRAPSPCSASGVQGRSHVEAMQTVLDDPIIRIWSRNPAHAEALALETHSVVAASIEEALRGRRHRLHRDRGPGADRRPRAASPPGRTSTPSERRSRHRESSARRPSRRRRSSSTGASRR